MCVTASGADENPLLVQRILPRFNRIRPEHIVPAIRHLLQELEVALAQLEAHLHPTWAGLVEPLERLSDRLYRTWGIVEHLIEVQHGEALRHAYEEVQGEVVRFCIRMEQSRMLYEGLKALQGVQIWQTLNPAQQRIVEALLLDATLAGVGLEGAQRERFNMIEQELAELSTQFSANIFDATHAFALVLTQPEEVEGLPPSALHLAARSARDAGIAGATPEQGPWRITLDYASFSPFMMYSRRRDLRERLYRAYITRASYGTYDNTPLIDRLLSLRHEKAALLGYANFAELSLAGKMASSVRAIAQLLEGLRQAAFDTAQQELEALKAFARSQRGTEAHDLAHWDVAFWAERLREHRYGFSDEDLRPYFPFPKVLEGLFTLTQRLFGVHVVAADSDIPVWHPDVCFFRLYNERAEEIGAFYLDPYSRPTEKHGGSWMSEYIGRSRLLASVGQSVRLPVAYLVCNFPPPVDGKPALLSFNEVKTLLHEFGHVLQHLLTTVDYGMASGSRNVEWDAIELPSLFMENWCYHRATLRSMSAHVETGTPLPDELYRKLCEARTFRAGGLLLLQLYLSAIDLELHARFDPNGSETVLDVQRRIAPTTLPLPLIPEDRLLCSFEHIFAGGYAAGYYSYLWAEVLSADAFAAFEEAGLTDEKALAKTGRRYRDTILALGGSQHPMEVYIAFRGRAPTPAALLHQRGLQVW